jgi:hypothetical protein
MAAMTDKASRAGATKTDGFRHRGQERKTERFAVISLPTQSRKRELALRGWRAELRPLGIG